MIVRQAANVLDLLEFFVRRREPATLSEIADSLGWPRSSTFNLIQTLVDRGYLYEPRPRSGYYPSPRWLSAAQHVAAAEPLPEFAPALVGELSAETGETAAIGAPAGINAIFVDVHESPAVVRYFAQVGHRLPIHATSTGRALLAQYTREERFALYRRIEFRQWSPTTPLSVDAVEAELQHAAERGYHQSLADFSPDLAGVALPLPVGDRRLAVVVAGPMFRMLDRLALVAEIIRRAIKRHAASPGTGKPLGQAETAVVRLKQQSSG
jgi:IclR family transcriptional regulator, acetate operon repressor